MLKRLSRLPPGVYKGRWLLLAALGVLVVGFYALGLHDYLTIDAIKEQRSAIANQFAESPLIVGGIYMLVFVAATTLSLPAAGIMSLASGAFFGFVPGTVISAVSTTLGATGAFLLSRYLFREPIAHRLGPRIETINRGIERDGGFYLFSLRLVAVFPFFVLNAAVALTSMRLALYFWVTLAAQFVMTAIFANAGTRLAEIEKLSDVTSPTLIISFALVAVFPLLAKIVVRRMRAR